MALSEFDETLWQGGVASLGSAATPGTYVAAFHNGSYDLRVDQLQLVNLDSVDHLIALAYGASDDAHMVLQVKLPAGRGTDGTPAISVLEVLQDAGHVYWFVQNGFYVYWTCREAITAGTVVNMTYKAGLFVGM